MPLTKFQAEVALLMSTLRTEDSHLAGGAALHFHPNSIRYSQDLDYFHDSEVRVGTAFQNDRDLLEKHGFTCSIEMNQPGYIRALISKSKNSTKVEWAHDSSWRFMPTQFIAGIGYVLHPIDSAINKVLTLAGRDEPRDYLDVQDTSAKTLALGGQCWAACGKDPGFNPLSLLELLKRRGKYRPEEFARLHLNTTIDVQDLKQNWLRILEEAEQFIRRAPPSLIGCLFFSNAQKKFIIPTFQEPLGEVKPHFCKPGGVLPTVMD